MEKERHPQERLVADAVDEGTDRENDEAKAPQAASRDAAELRLRKAELGAPVAENAAADRKADAGRGNRQKTGE
jgi:hypothetical protein